MNSEKDFLLMKSIGDVVKNKEDASESIKFHAGFFVILLVGILIFFGIVPALSLLIGFIWSSRIHQTAFRVRTGMYYYSFVTLCKKSTLPVHVLEVCSLLNFPSPSSIGKDFDEKLEKTENEYKRKINEFFNNKD